MHISHKPFIFIGLLFLCCCHSPSPGNSQKLFPVKELQTDFQVFRKTMEEAHPGLYWYSSKQEINGFLDSLYKAIDHPMDETAFFKLLVPAIVRVRCVHTAIHPSEQTQQELSSSIKLLPLDVGFVGDKIYIKKNFENPSQTGLEIRSINGMPAGEMLEKFLAIIPADGYNTTFKYNLLSRGLFREAYGLLIGQPDQFILDVTDSSGKTFPLTLPAKTAASLRREPVTDSEAITWSFLDEHKIAVLTIKTFELSGQFFNERISAFFMEMKRNGYPKLIIDLQNNGGGNNGNVSRLFAWLAEKPFYHLRKTEVMARTLTYGNHITNYGEYRNTRAIRAEDSTYHVDYNYPGRSLQSPAPDAFHGLFSVLVNGGTVSAASEFVALVRGNKRGLVFGEETGGCYYGATGGNYLNLILPNSHLRIRIPTVRIFTAVPEDFINQPPGRGIIPDHIISNSIDDLKNPVLDAALKFWR